MGQGAPPSLNRLSHRACHIFPSLTSTPLLLPLLHPPHPPPPPHSGLGAAWHLDHVEILHQATGERTYFVAERWLDKKEGTSIVVLEPANAPGQKQTYKVGVKGWGEGLEGAGLEADVQGGGGGGPHGAILIVLIYTDMCVGCWQVSVQTGDKRGGGTDADVSVILFGSEGTSSEVKLDNSKNNFERNQVGGGGEGPGERARDGAEAKASCSSSGAATRFPSSELGMGIALLPPLWLYCLSPSPVMYRCTAAGRVLPEPGQPDAGRGEEAGHRLRDAAGCWRQAGRPVRQELALDECRGGAPQHRFGGGGMEEVRAAGGECEACLAVAVMLPPSDSAPPPPPIPPGNRTFFLYDDWITGEKRRVQLVPGKVGENNTYKVSVLKGDTWCVSRWIEGGETVPPCAYVTLVLHTAGCCTHQRHPRGRHRLQHHAVPLRHARRPVGGLGHAQAG